MENRNIKSFNNVLINDGGLLTDVYSKLFDDRIVFLQGPITDDSSNLLKAQLLYLNQISTKDPIILYIDSPGGDVYTGLGIIDVMDFIQAPVETVNIGLAASMAAVVLCNGQAGKRRSLKHSRVLLHQPSGGIEGQSTDMQIAAKEIEEIKGELNKIIAKNTKKPISEIRLDAERDFWMGAKKAKEYGLIDRII